MNKKINIDIDLERLEPLCQSLNSFLFDKKVPPLDALTTCLVLAAAIATVVGIDEQNLIDNLQKMIRRAK